MAQGPWRCSQCGTINEPVANSCRTCGRWPSLFDLEDSVVEDAEVEYEPLVESPAPEPYEAPQATTVEVETFEEAPAPAPRRRFEPPPTDPVFEADEETSRGPRWVTWLVPLAFVVYLVISILFSNR